MRASSIRRPDVVRDALQVIYHPGGGLARQDGSLDRCTAKGAALGRCLRMAYAQPYATHAGTCYCTLPPFELPAHVQPAFCTDGYGTTYRLCAHRVSGWMPGPSLPPPRWEPPSCYGAEVDASGAAHPRNPDAPPYIPPRIRSWLRGAVCLIAVGEELLAATARAYVDGDWSAVDESDERGEWARRENERRRMWRVALIGEVGITTEWRLECQRRLFKDIARRAAQERPWNGGMACTRSLQLHQDAASPTTSASATREPQSCVP